MPDGVFFSKSVVLCASVGVEAVERHKDKMRVRPIGATGWDSKIVCGQDFEITRSKVTAETRTESARTAGFMRGAAGGVPY